MTAIDLILDPNTGNTVYSILGGRVSELIMDIAMSDKC